MTLILDWRILLPTGALLLALLLGFVLAWPQWAIGLHSGDKGFLQNLLSEGLGVLVSTIIIAPLSAYFVEKRRNRELEPTRRQLFENICDRIDSVTSESGMVLASIEALAAYIKSLSHLGTVRQFLARADTEPQRNDAIAHDARMDPGMLRAMRELASCVEKLTDLRDHLEAIEAQIAISAPVLTVSMVSGLADVVNEVRHHLSELHILRKFLSGHATTDERDRALNSRPNIGGISGSLDVLLRKLGHPELSSKVRLGDPASYAERWVATIEELADFVDAIYYEDVVREREEAVAHYTD